MMDSSIATTSSSASCWFAMTTTNPKLTEQLLLQENARRISAGLMAFQYFVPYQFLQRRQSDAHPLEALSNNEIRSALHRYIFIRSTEPLLRAMLTDELTAYGFRELWFLYDQEHRCLTISDAEMEHFIEGCNDCNLQFELWPAVGHLEKGVEVVLNAGPFKGTKAQVLDVRQGKSGCQLTVGFHVLAGTMLLRMSAVQEKDVLFGGGITKSDRRLNGYRLIEDVQRRLFEILNHRAQRLSDSETLLKDAQLLDAIYNYRYHQFSTDVSRRHFLALLLICAVLRHDSEDCQRLTAQAEADLAAINMRPPSKAATDVRTWLQCALYIATGNPKHRTDAKIYVQNGMTESAPLQQLVRFIRKNKI